MRAAVEMAELGGRLKRVLSQEIPRENDVRDGSGVEVPLPSFLSWSFVPI